MHRLLKDAWAELGAIAHNFLNGGLSRVGAEMAMPSSSFVLFTQFLLYLKVTHCMEVDFCRPVRLSQKKPGVYLHRRAEQMNEYEIVFRLRAFREDFYLHLSPDSSFIAAGSVSAPDTFAGSEFRECFYSGYVNADPDSFAALSLCKGLQGGFFYNGVEYFISQTETENAGAASVRGNSFDRTHIIRRRRRPAHSAGNFTSRCEVPPDTNFTVSLERYKYMRELETDGLTETVLNSLGRSKRFAAVPRFVEVLVVADESMAKFHGDGLKHYVLTLMSVAARLYKHPSILNSINIVVVGFMVINDDDKGPKVSSNAALTLRNFCSWQKKLNKHSDKHPEYWDTAILFTKQVGQRARAALEMWVLQRTELLHSWMDGQILESGAQTHTGPPVHLDTKTKTQL